MPSMGGFKVQHLLLLVGGNPLPNAVAGALLAAPGGRVSLIHTKETSLVAARLRAWLVQQGHPDVKLGEVEEANPASIVRGVQSQLCEANAWTIGLNYTGGTKVMSVHAYRAVQEWGKNRRISPVFSYLDARTLTMRFDPEDPGSGQPSCAIYVGREVKPSVEDLLHFHDFKLQHRPTESPVLPQTAQALAAACSSPESLAPWKVWVDGTLRVQCRRKDRDDKWKSNSELCSLQIALPEIEHLAPAMQTLRAELHLPSGLISLDQPTSGYKPQMLCEWLDGKWLEHHVLHVLNNLQDGLKPDYCAQNIETRDIQFDVDVVALRGYQLFAFSCSTDTTKPLLKQKLFEAYIRARQLGGDEARTALVCCSETPDLLEREMRRDVDTEGRIMVFGMSHLADLKQHIREWIRTQSGEG